MEFELSSDNRAIQENVRAFAAKEIRPHVAEWEKEGTFPRHIYAKMGELGYLGAIFPQQYGGSELGFLNLALICEEIGRVHEALGSAFNMNSTTCPFPILNWGSEIQRQRFVPEWIAGKKIGFFALTEPGGGTDVAGGMRTRGMKRGKSYILNGTKQFITLGTVADVGLLFCKTDLDKGARGISAFIVETSRPGFSASSVDTRVLGKCWPTSVIHLDNVEVPIDHLVGEEGQGFSIAMNALDYGRLSVAARCLGIAQAALDEMVAYANQRHAFGQPIGQFQQVQAAIANTLVEVATARLLVYQLGWTLDVSGTSQPLLSSYAKYWAAEVAYRAAERGFEILGGYAVTDDFPMARHLNTAALLRTGEGSANLQRVLIAQDALGYRTTSRYKIPQTFPLSAPH